MTIKEVKESIVSPDKIQSPEATYKTGPPEPYKVSTGYNTYAVPTQMKTYQFSSNNKYSIATSPKQSEYKSLNKDITLPSYGTYKTSHHENQATYQTTTTYENKKDGKRSYLADLDLKQSINVEEPKKD